jgi:hypothetical protein
MIVKSNNDYCMEQQPNHCDRCFKDLNKEDHQKWCPYHKTKDYDMPEGFEEIFGFNKNKNE